MANIITIQPIRYAQSILSGTLTGLLRTKPGNGIALQNLQSVDGFEISGVQPSGTDRRVAFGVGDVWYRISPDGSLEELMEQDFTADSVLYEGNTADELEAIAGIPAFIDKEVSFAVALSAPSADAAMPTLGITVKGTTSVPQTETVIISPVYEVVAESLILYAAADMETENGGTVAVQARITDPAGAVGDWGPLSLLQGKKISAVQFWATLTAPQIGVSAAKLSQVAMQYRSGDDIISGVGIAELISVTTDWHRAVEDSRITFFHPALTDARLSAQCAIRDRANVVTGEQIGIGTGERAVYTLANTDGIQFDSVAVHVNGVRVSAGWELNTEVGRITMTAPLGTLLTADYVHGWTEEVWTDMQLTGTVHSPVMDESEFKYLVPGNAEEKSICAVKIGLELTDGHADGDALGVGTGKSQVYALPHAVKAGHISVSADGEPLPPESWTLLEGARRIQVAAALGAALTASYDWVSETPTVSKFIAVFG